MFQYRVGALGFLHPREGDANCGLWDVVAVLHWVQKEIQSFGGDPASVTVLGQSAGADLVLGLCGAPPAKGLFHQAVIMSPASLAVTRAQANDLADEFTRRLGLEAPPHTVLQFSSGIPSG